MLLTRIYKTTFEAAHLIEGHPECGVKHGHSYNVTIKVTGNSSQWVDFKEISADADGFIKQKLDHKDLGNITAEEICYKITKHLLDRGYAGQVELWETAKYGVLMAMMSTATEEANVIFAKCK